MAPPNGEGAQMYTKTPAALAALVVMLLGGYLHAFPASAAAGAATITSADPTRVCTGDAATLTWEPPEGVDDLVGFEITRQNYNGVNPSGSTITVGPAQRSLDFTVGFFMNSFLIRTVTSSGVTYEPFATAYVVGSQAPMAMEWDHHVDPGDVGDGFAAVRFAWAGPVKTFTLGGVLPVAVRITASPGGESIEIPTSGWSVAHTFTGLTNGLEYTFSAVTFNACGARRSLPSATHVPGVRPVWVQADPPLSVKKNKLYEYQFAASGTPAPTYALRDAPAWLKLSSDGLVSGEPPKDATTFSFSVLAENRVGIEYPWLERPVVAGPFTVTVGRGPRPG